ncbi:predicted protein [Uncinocarpus reesii 1704]|uniref:Uncharacterized protein n=1 Tax=Uncinocarpus reesii (strain UAMH 1704) TaxID=336963 RepID=C4JEN8_UNCRE|nr:uncharacterized protein UREG_02198 [Uncinocarpus reesii 1704]EEP77349.1 predicted protein [Uncinocarpus reesii 1704]
MAAPLDTKSSVPQNIAAGSPEDIKKFDPDMASDGCDSERRLVSALAQLQELDAKARRKGDDRFSGPKSPQELFDQLSQTTREGHQEIEAFKAAWRSPETQAAFDRAKEKLKESDGNYPQTTGTWERDYGAILTRFDTEKRLKDEEQRNEQEEEEKKLLASTNTSQRFDWPTSGRMERYTGVTITCNEARAWYI